MAAERRRAAALDRTHHLQLLEADMPALASRQADRGRGKCPRPPELVEPFRRRYAGGPSFVLPYGSAFAAAAQPLQRALDLCDHSGRHAGVARRRLQLLVSEQRLDDRISVPRLEQMRCEAMAKRMQRQRFAQPRGFRGLLEQPAELARGQRPMLTRPGNSQRCSGATPASTRSAAPSTIAATA